MSTNVRLRSMLRVFRRLSTKDWTFVISFSAISIVFGFFTLVPNIHESTSAADLVDLTLLRDTNDGRASIESTPPPHHHNLPVHPNEIRVDCSIAVCLDGSVPGYHFQKGFGTGSRNWLLHIEGGGWCSTPGSCSFRKSTALGSSAFMERSVRFSGILSSNPSQNPDFYNWNKIKIRYCDGASLSGHPEAELNSGTKLFFRGHFIWEALMMEFLSIGLSKAEQALLSGCSAGGLATLIHCDDFRDLLPKDVTVKCLADAGFFLDEKDVLGNRTMRSFYRDVAVLQGVAKTLQKKCDADIEPSEEDSLFFNAHLLCLFPQHIVKNINSPVFLVNPAYDFWQIQHILVPDASDPRGYWQKCRLNIHDCNASQIKALQGFRDSLLIALSNFKKKKDSGLFVNSCFTHCQTWMTETWHSPNSPKINNQSIAESVGDWYFNRKTVKQIDCPYPCNPTCIHLNFSSRS